VCMYTYLVCFLILCLGAVLALEEPEYQVLFSKWMRQHKKQYVTEELFTRYHIFKSNLININKHNEVISSYSLGMNAFGDLTSNEFRSRNNGNRYDYQNNGYQSRRNSSLVLTNDYPPSLDWRSHRNNPSHRVAVTSVKNQGQCASCYAFASVGAIEGAWALSNGSLISLSPQQLVDCSSPFNNSGCDGGSITNAFEYVMMTGGIDSDEQYPYKAYEGDCAIVEPYEANIIRYVNVTANSDRSLFEAVQKGPVAVSIEADISTFQFYSGGVYDDVECGTNLDHGVLVVGYGVLESQLYWIVKNSWSAAWGLEGYIYMARIDGVGECGINMQPSYPVVMK